MDNGGFTRPRVDRILKTTLSKGLHMSPLEELYRIGRTAGYSFDGWCRSWREEKSLRQWLAVNLVGWGALSLLQPPLWAMALVVLTGLLLLVLELVNSAVEAAVDHTSTERHPLAKAAKDAGSAAVAVMAIGYGAVWVFALLA
jgi:diacylglycerol kinase (ATP)